MNTADRILIGVDAGGSHTTALLADAHGAALGQAHGEPGAVRPGRENAAADAIADTCRRVLRHLRPGSRADVLVVGAAGAGADGPRAALKAALDVADLAAQVHVTTDAAIALAAALGDEPGIVLLAGTGSIAWARLPDGSTTRLGGLGPTLGDHGSGYDLGRHGLRAAALAYEGLGPDTRLRELLLPDTNALAEAVRAQHEIEPRVVAMLARLVIEAADGGDAVALDIVERGADMLARHAVTLGRRYATDARTDVALGGGLLASLPSYRDRVAARVAALAPQLRVSTDPIEPARGAIRMARAL
jgi:N-acetylglucosamine kinase-like BadF-type ATPase